MSGRTLPSSRWIASVVALAHGAVEVRLRIGFAAIWEALWAVGGRTPRLAVSLIRTATFNSRSRMVENSPIGMADSVRASRVASAPNLYAIPDACTMSLANPCYAVNTMG